MKNEWAARSKEEIGELHWPVFNSSIAYSIDKKFLLLKSPQPWQRMNEQTFSTWAGALNKLMLSKGEPSTQANSYAYHKSYWKSKLKSQYKCYIYQLSGKHILFSPCKLAYL